MDLSILHHTGTDHNHIMARNYVFYRSKSRFNDIIGHYPSRSSVALLPASLATLHKYINLVHRLTRLFSHNRRMINYRFSYDPFNELKREVYFLCLYRLKLIVSIRKTRPPLYAIRYEIKPVSFVLKLMNNVSENNNQ